jgi:hypothetical protein
MHVCVFMKEVYVFFVFAMQITCAHGGHSCCKVMHACIGVCVMVCIRHMFTMIAAGLCVLVCTRPHCDCCEAMHACAESVFWLYKAFVHGDCCEAMLLCAYVRAQMM